MGVIRVVWMTHLAVTQRSPKAGTHSQPAHIPPYPPNHLSPPYASPANSRADANTSSNIFCVSRPVCVFCWLGW